MSKTRGNKGEDELHTSIKAVVNKLVASEEFIALLSNAIMDVITKKKKLLKEMGMIIRGDLSPETQKLLKAVVDKIKKNGRVWSNNGNIYVKFNDKDFISKIKKLSDIEMSCQLEKMSPIENVAPTIVEVTPEVQLRHKTDRSRDLFGVQLEVTSLLLEAERRKLKVLQRELQEALDEGGSIKAKEHQKQELLIAIARIQAQHDLLDKEYREHALGALLSANTRGSGKVSKIIFSKGSQKFPIFSWGNSLLELLGILF
ncbi:hypothetical protein JTB14_021166 [Gonioctena quinquepunctata]|nr:hypothetical protein JTB14_021166 [Gonioctena quinquepunctata]